MSGILTRFAPIMGNLQSMGWLSGLLLLGAIAGPSSPSPNGSNTIREDVTFSSGDTQLAGSFVFPASGPIRAGVIFVHGSGEQTRFLQGAERFAQDGIAAFVYDKRGVGESGGEYESRAQVGEENLLLLADDALAAFETLAAHPKLQGVALGMTGISQAGWIVPLAAAACDELDFVVLWSGPVCKVSEEDIYSKYTADRDAGKAPSYESALAARETPYVWPDFLGRDTDAAEDLSFLKVRGLWLFGAQDGSVPVDLSMERLDQLASEGHRYEYVLFSAAGHNNLGETFATANDWILNVAAR